MKKIIALTFLFVSIAMARNITVKMATLAPEGTDWHGMLIEMGQEWKEFQVGIGIPQLAKLG